MQTLKMDFQSQSAPPVVPVMQFDAQSRFIGITLYNGGVPYEAPEGASYTVQYRGPGANNMGWYDTITLSSGTRKAVIVDSASKNVVTLELAEQALRVNGNVFVNLCVVTNTGYMLKTFPILCRVTGAAFPDTVAVQSFFYVTGITSEQWLAYVTACQDAQKRAEDAAATFETDPTLSLSGKAADAAKVGEAVGQLKEDLGDIDYIVFKDKINKLIFNSEGSSSNITLNGNTITSINATKEQYKAFINTSLFENGRKYVAVIKFKNNSSTDITVYANAFSYRFYGLIGKTQGLGVGKSETSVMPYTAQSDVRGFSIYSTTENASYTADIYIYDVTDKDISNIDFSVGGTKIKILKSDLEKPYFGKILCTYGDSITAQQTWQDYVQRELGFSKYYNHGVGGRRLMAMATDECLAEITEDFDVMLVMGGTNDWAQDRTVGTETDINTDEQTFTGTFYGGLNTLIKKLLVKYPTKRIVFMTQTPVKNSNGEAFFNKKGSADGLKNSNGNTTRDFARATLNACGNNHVPCVDLNSLVGWNENNISSFVKNENDTFFHPTSVGGKRIAECISGFLKSLQSIN